MDIDNRYEELRLKKICKACEEEYLENPTNVDNLTKWGAALMELSQYGILNEQLNCLTGSVSKLEEALTIDPAKHEARWCLGNVQIVKAFLISDEDEVNILFDEALRCFQRAAKESPRTVQYLKSLVSHPKVRQRHKELYANAELDLGQVQQTLSKGPAAASTARSSTATFTAKNKSSESKYDICGWVILAVGIATFIGVAKSHMSPPPAR